MKISTTIRRYTPKQLGQLNLEGIRAVYRIWIKTGILIPYNEKRRARTCVYRKKDD